MEAIFNERRGKEWERERERERERKREIRWSHGEKRMERKRKGVGRAEASEVCPQPVNTLNYRNIFPFMKVNCAK